MGFSPGLAAARPPYPPVGGSLTGMGLRSLSNRQMYPEYDGHAE